MADFPFCTLEEPEELELVDAMRLLEWEREIQRRMKHQEEDSKSEKTKRSRRNAGEEEKKFKQWRPALIPYYEREWRRKLILFYSTNQFTMKVSIYMCTAEQPL